MLCCGAKIFDFFEIPIFYCSSHEAHASLIVEYASLDSVMIDGVIFLDQSDVIINGSTALATSVASVSLKKARVNGMIMARTCNLTKCFLC